MSDWINNIISRSHSVEPICSMEIDLIKKSIAIASVGAPRFTFGQKIAAFYDLVISAVYYSNITNDGWLYCSGENTPRLVLPFINCCPIHALRKSFIFHNSSKPTSAKIGQATTRVLLLYFQELFAFNNENIEVLKAVEPADAIFLDRNNRKVLFTEIKSSPLLTPALSTPCDLMYGLDKYGDHYQISHKKSTNPNLINSELNIMIPIKKGKKWEMKEYNLGCKKNPTDTTFAYEGLLTLLDNDDFVAAFLDYWICSFNLYCKKDDQENIFWLTNACGKPNGLTDWTGGSTCISDEKTSVGMDRTDDIKKGIYQVLKLGSEGKPNCKDWDYKVGILSNIHPARHFSAYIAPIKDMIWAICQEKNIKIAGDLDPQTKVFNLFDGIITFTQCYMRDNWLENKLSILNNNTSNVFKTEK